MKNDQLSPLPQCKRHSDKLAEISMSGLHGHTASAGSPAGYLRRAALEEDALGAQRAVHDKGAVQRRHPARDVERQDLARCSRLPRAHELVPEKRLHSATSSYYIVLSTPEYF